jgi:hypothetical protein
LPKARAALCVLAAALLLGTVYAEGPPPAHTGGFGEPTCQACHFEGDLNDPAGMLSLDGIPATYSPGHTYTVTVTLHRPGLERGGFQLSTRFADGTQAGTLRADTEHLKVTNGPGDVQYVHHLLAGTAPVHPDTARWTLTWQAPAEPGGPVVVHAAANASNGDDSEFGDYIYTASRKVKGE